MSTTKTDSTLFEKLEQKRDELKVQMHLGKAEAKDQWDELEQKWKEAQRHRRQLEQAGAESATELKAAAGLLLDEIAEGYARIRKAL